MRGEISCKSNAHELEVATCHTRTLRILIVFKLGPRGFPLTHTLLSRTSNLVEHGGQILETAITVYQDELEQDVCPRPFNVFSFAD